MAIAKAKNKPRFELGIQEARSQLKKILDRVQYNGERAVISRYGDEAVAIVSIDDLAKIEAA